jgi:glycosyltransferase involved in cell wall biosynthesis
MVACNEEARIQECLESAKDFSEIVVVVDARTSDRTAEICRGFGCRVFVEEWKGYGPQNRSALDKCSNEWVFIIDADERIPSETIETIRETLSRPAADAYSFPRKNFLHGRWMKHGDWWPDRQVRLIRKSRGSFNAIVHARWVTEGRLEELETPIEHFSFNSYRDMLTTLNNYSGSTAAELHAKGKRVHVVAPCLHGAWMFFKIYFLKRGFLDGLDGLVTALLKAGGSFFKYAKLIEIQRTTRK